MAIMAKLAERRSAYSAHPRDPVIAEWLGLGNRSAAGISVTATTAMKLTVVNRCVQILSQTYASLPLSIYALTDDGGMIEARNHPLWRVLCRKPNKFQTSFEWREMMAGHFSLRNRCYSRIVSTGGRGIAELIPLHPDRVTPFRAPNGKLAFEYRPLEGPAEIILQDEMHFLHGIALDDDGITPMSPIQAACEAMGLSLAAEHHSASLFGNGTRLGGIIKMKSHMRDDVARKKFMDSFNDAYRGATKSGKTALFEDGMEWQQLGMSSQDAELIRTREFQIPELCRIFGVPPHKVFDLGRATFSNIEHQGIEFVQDTIRPGAIRREEAYERDLFSDRDAQQYAVAFDLDGLMRGDSAARSAYYSSAVQNGYMTRNEVRVAEGNNPMRVDGMDKFTVQLNMATVEQIGIMPEPAATVRELDKMGMEVRSLRDSIAATPPPPPVYNIDARTEVNQAPPPAIEVKVEPTTVNVATPEVRVHVDPTTVNVSPPNVTVNQAETHINVEQPEVSLEATLPTPTVIVSLPPRKTETTVERDADGNIVKTSQIESDA